MFTIYKNLSRMREFNKGFKVGITLINEGKNEEAFKKFTELHEKEPFDPYVRYHLIKLGNQLHKEVSLSELLSTSCKLKN